MDLTDFIHNYYSNNDFSIISQIKESISFKDPTLLFTFVLDYNLIDKPITDYILELLDFDRFSKQFTKDVKKVIAGINREFYDKIQDLNIKARFKNFLYDAEKIEYPNLVPIRSLSSRKMDRYVCFRGIVRNIEMSEGSIRKQKFKCLNCELEMTLDFNNLDDTFDGKHCIACNGPEGANLEMIKAIGGTTDVQILTIEEFTNDSESDASSTKVVIDNDLTNKFNLGDPVIVTGNIRLDVYNDAIVNQFKKKTTDLKFYKYLSTYGGPTNGISVNWFIEANYIEKINDTNIIFNNISDEELYQIEELRKDPHLIDRMVQSFAPDIYGYNVEKEVMIYQQIGGNGRSLDPELNKRGEIHIFFLGDPSTAKSELMEWSLGISHKCRFVYGGTLTKAGLTGGASKAEGTGNWVLSAGVAVVADMGMIGIDEFNNAPIDAIKALAQIMEKQESAVTTIKAGTFKSRVSVIACANPPDGNRYDKGKTFMQNIGINISAFTRFDFVSIFRDIPEPNRDSLIAEKIIKSYEKSNIPPISRELLAKYIYYMKNRPNIPKMSKEANDEFIRYYVKIRTLDFNENIKHLDEQEHVSITARQLQSLMRFATARARLLGKSEVDESDVKAGERIIDYLLTTIGIDPETGKIDASILLGSKASSQMTMDTIFFELLERMSKSFGNRVDYDQFIGELRKRDKWRPEDITEEKLHKRIDKYQDQQYLIVVDGNISLRKNVQSVSRGVS